MFKVGDRVRFTEDVSDEATAKKGDEATVVRFCPSGLPILDTDPEGDNWGWAEDVLELITPAPDHTPTLRDLFAMAALPAMIQRMQPEDLNFAMSGDPEKTIAAFLSETSYQFADAMLKAREAG